MTVRSFEVRALDGQRVRLAFELSGEHPTLPRADALGALEAENVTLRRIAFSPQLLLVDAARPPARALRRVALSHYVIRVLRIGQIGEIVRSAGRYPLRGRRFSVRAHGPFRPADKRDVERRVGASLSRTGVVDLENPEREFRVLRYRGELLFGEVRHTVDRSELEARKVARRSFSRPVSLHPKFARTLVNLARCPTGGVFLDPFCGTGGIALEAARLGMRVRASDLDEQMVDGTRSVLRQFGLRASVFQADIGEVAQSVPHADGIATDPPYGRAATTRGEPLLGLYRRSFAVFRDVLRPGGFAALTLPSQEAVAVGEESLRLVEAHAVRVHRSLTRTFCAFVKEP